MIDFFVSFAMLFVVSYIFNIDGLLLCLSVYDGMNASAETGNSMDDILRLIDSPSFKIFIAVASVIGFLASICTLLSWLSLSSPSRAPGQRRRLGWKLLASIAKFSYLISLPLWTSLLVYGITNSYWVGGATGLFLVFILYTGRRDFSGTVKRITTGNWPLNNKPFDKFTDYFLIIIFDFYLLPIAVAFVVAWLKTFR